MGKQAAYQLRPMEVLHASWRPTLLPWASLLADCAPVVVDMSTSATAEGKLCFTVKSAKTAPAGSSSNLDNQAVKPMIFMTAV